MPIPSRDTSIAPITFPSRKPEFPRSPSEAASTIMDARPAGDYNRRRTTHPIDIISRLTSTAPIGTSLAPPSSPTLCIALDSPSATHALFLPGTPTRNSGPRATLLERVSDPNKARLAVNSGRSGQRDQLLALRGEFPILEKTNYLVSNSLGPMPRTVPEKLAEYARDWGELGVKAWNRGWWELPVNVGNEIAPLINADDGEIVMMPNVTIAQTAVLSSIDFSKDRDTVVMTELDFPSVRYAYSEMAKRFGARVVDVKSDDGLTIDRDRLLDAIDERTRVVAVSHVLFRSAFLMDVDEICRHAHDAGALVSLDSFHAVGVVPV